MAVPHASAVISENELTISSYLGGGFEEAAVRGAVIQSDGTVVLAANMNGDLPGGSREHLLDGAARHWRGAILRLSPDGTQVLSVTRLAERVLDLAVDGDDRLYVAAWNRGLLVLTADARMLLWKKTFSGRNVWRVAAGASGVHAVLTHGAGGRAADPDSHSPGSGHLYVYDGAGRAVTDFGGYRNTLDVALHEPSETVIHIGWRQARSWEGTTTYPVQIAYLRGVDFSGQVRYLGYDWSTDRESDRFLNKPENNMADTRGIRCEIGADGLLYVAYECAGGNHIFRYSPFDVMQKVPQAGGDRYHSFYNTRSEHKTFLARHDPATGDYLLGQEFCARLNNGRGNAVRPHTIVADAEGRVYLGGSSAYGLPLSWLPPGTGEYAGGGWLMILSPDLSTRLFSTRMGPKSVTHVVATTKVQGRQHVVIGGETETPDEFFLKHPLIENFVAPRAGFFTVFGAEGGAAAAAAARHTPPLSSRQRPARPVAPEHLAQAERMLVRKLVELTEQNRLRPVPMPLSHTAFDVVLRGVTAEQVLTYSRAAGDTTITADFEFSTLTAMDKANLAVLVTVLEPENEGAKGLAGYFLEVAGATARADDFFEQAGERVRREFLKWFVP